MRGSLGDLALMPGMPSEPTLRKLMAERPDFPIIARGSNGVAYEIELADAFAFVRGLEDEKRKLVDARNAEIRQLGFELLGDDAASAAMAPSMLSSADRKQILEEELAAIRVGERRRELVRKGPVIAATGDLVLFIAERMKTLPDRLGKRTHVSREVLAALDRLIEQDRRDIAARMERAVDAFSGDEDTDPAV
jgi:hypothetical protein